jgi:hypothetical protein
MFCRNLPVARHHVASFSSKVRKDASDILPSSEEVLAAQFEYDQELANDALVPLKKAIVVGAYDLPPSTEKYSYEASAASDEIIAPPYVEQLLLDQYLANDNSDGDAIEREMKLIADQELASDILRKPEVDPSIAKGHKRMVGPEIASDILHPMS